MASSLYRLSLPELLSRTTLLSMWTPLSMYFPLSDRERYERGEITEYDPRQWYNPILFLRTTNSTPLWSVRTLDRAYLEYDTRSLNYIRSLPQQSPANQCATDRYHDMCQTKEGNFIIFPYPWLPPPDPAHRAT